MAQQQELSRDDASFLKVVKWTVGTIIVLILLIMGYSMRPVVTVEPGYVGVVQNFDGLSPEVMPAGLHFRMPVRDTVHPVYVGTARVDEKLAAASNDKQVVTVDFALNYRVNPAAAVSVYRDLSNDPANRIIQPTMVDVAKATISQFDTNQLVTQRDSVNQKITDNLKSRLAPYGITVVSTALLNLDFSQQYNDAIEAAASAQQKSIQAQNELKQTQFDSQKRVIQSQADLEAARNQAQANDLLGKSLEANPAIIEKLKVEKWNGEYPQYMLGGAIPLIQVGK